MITLQTRPPVMIRPVVHSPPSSTAVRSSPYPTRSLPQNTKKMDFAPITPLQHTLQSRLPLLLRFPANPAIPISVSILLLYHLLLFAAFLAPPFPHRRGIFLGVITALLLRLLNSTTYLGPPRDYTLSIWVLGEYLCFSSVYLCGYPPERNAVLSQLGYSSQNWRTRLSAAWEVYINRRLVAAPPPPPPHSQPSRSRTRFVIWHLARAAAYFLLLAVLEPQFPTAANVLTSSLPRRVVRANVAIGSIYLLLSLMHSFVAAVSVLMRMSSPASWPPLFGSLSTCHSVRNVWRFWHQLLAFPFRAHSSWAADGLGLKRGGAARYIFTVFASFFLSGLLHAVPAWVVSGTDAQSMAYFLLQGVGIVL
ncbi:hypothetical protein FN846DRAFT_963550, partial [Sphaerosporella brunnea]